MSRIRLRIAALVGGTVLITLLLILAIFNINIRKDTRKKVEESFKYTSGYWYGDVNAPYTPVVMLINGDYHDKEPVDEYDEFYYGTGSELVQWCREHEPEGIVEAEIGEKFYYLRMRKLSKTEYREMFGTAQRDSDGELIYYDPMGDEYDEYYYEEDYEYLEDFLPNEEELGYELAFLDLSSEPDTIMRMNIFFLIAAAVTGLLGSIEGYFIGGRLEKDKLSQKQFFENTSHELKTPLTSIRGYAEGIEMGIITDYKKTGRVITAQTEKMSRLIEEILYVAKLESGALTLDKEYLEISEFIENCLMPLEGAVMSRGIEVGLDLNKDKVFADPDRLEHALTNLLTNALKYARSRIDISYSDKALKIHNDCSSLTKEELKHIFDRFHTGKGGSTGIGLALAKEIIELHGWTIRADSEGDGITFTVTVG